MTKPLQPEHPIDREAQARAMRELLATAERRTAVQYKVEVLPQGGYMITCKKKPH